MLNRLQKIFVTLFLLILPVLLAYLISRSAPDVRYTLSEEIPVSFLGSGAASTEVIQQLEVRNIGNAEAARLVAKINGQIDAYEIQKYSASDVVQVFDNQPIFELIYPQLPPQAGFKIIFKSSGSGIEYRDVTISHNSGAAQEALSKTDAGLLGALAPWISIGMAAVYFVIGLNSVRKISVDNWETQAEGKSPQQIAQLKQPWYMFDKEWQPIRARIVKRKIRSDSIYEHDLQKSASYHWLSMEKPDYVADADWGELNETAADRLSKTYSSAVNSAFHETVLTDLLQVKRPKHFPVDKWNDLEKRANERFVALKERAMHSSESVRQALLETKPAVLSEASWVDLNARLQDKYYEFLVRELTRSDDPDALIERADLRLLDERRGEFLKMHAADMRRVRKQNKESEEIIRLLTQILRGEELGKDKPDQIKDWEWERLKILEKGIGRKESEEIIRLLTQILRGEELGKDKPDQIKDWEWERLKILEKDIAGFKEAEKLRRETEEMSAKSRKESEEIIRLLTQILRGEELGKDKPDQIKDWEWERLKILEKDIAGFKEAEKLHREAEEMSAKSRAELLRLASELQTLQNLKQKVERQLSIIHEVLSDPTAIERAEYLDDIFAPGNIENLKIVAQTLNTASGMCQPFETTWSRI